MTSSSPAKKTKIFYDCGFSYLRDNELLTFKKHMNYSPAPVEEDICTEVLAAFSDEVLANLKPLIEADPRFTKHSNCIIEKLTTFSIDIPYLMKFIYSEDRTMSKLRRMKALNEVSSKIDQKLELAEEICAPEQMFGDWFDETVDEEPSTASDNSTDADVDLEELREEYCQRVYVVEKKAIDLKKYKIDTNPKGVNVQNMDCKKFLLEISEEFIVSIKDQFAEGVKYATVKSTRCMANTVRNGKYFDNLLKIWMLSELKISDQEKAVERNHFINFLKNLYAEIMKCDV